LQRANKNTFTFATKSSLFSVFFFGGGERVSDFGGLVFRGSSHCCFYLCFVGVQHAPFDFLPLFFLGTAAQTHLCIGALSFYGMPVPMPMPQSLQLASAK